MRTPLVVTLLVLGTVLAAGAAEAGPSVSVNCGYRPEHEIRVDSDGHDYTVDRVTVTDAPGYYSQCPLQASQTSSASASCSGTPVAYTAVWTVYVYSGSCYGVQLTDEKNPSTFQCPSAEDAPCTIGVVASL